MTKESRPLKAARAKTKKVQHDLELVCAELELTQQALQRHLPREVKQSGDVAWALAHNDRVEHRVQEAAEELGEVQELLAHVEEA